jgi:uncharacterized membrane protein
LKQQIFDKVNTRTLVFGALGVALMWVVTAFLQVPMFGSGGGYVHLGDTVLFVFAAVGGPVIGAMTGGVGGLLADLYLGYPVYAVFTLVIKAVQGLVVGLMVAKSKRVGVYIGSLAIAGTWMVVGYFLTELVVYSWEVAIVGIIGNTIQIVVNMMLAVIVYPSIRRLHNANAIEAYNNQLIAKLSVYEDKVEVDMIEDTQHKDS